MLPSWELEDDAIADCGQLASGSGLVLVALDENLRAELLARREIDQRQRLRPDGDIEEMERVDQDNSTWLRALVSDRGWPGHSLVGVDGAQSAFLLAQHTPDHELQRWFLQHLRAAVDDGEAEPAELAFLEDRVRMFLGRPQRYGSQFTLVDGALHLYEVEDPDTLDDRRAAVGLEPFAEYQRRIQSLYTAEGADEHHDDNG
jgi:hypothetical protein